MVESYSVMPTHNLDFPFNGGLQQDAASPPIYQATPVVRTPSNQSDLGVIRSIDDDTVPIVGQLQQNYSFTEENSRPEQIVLSRPNHHHFQPIYLNRNANAHEGNTSVRYITNPNQVNTRVCLNTNVQCSNTVGYQMNNNVHKLNTRNVHQLNTNFNVHYGNINVQQINTNHQQVNTLPQECNGFHPTINNYAQQTFVYLPVLAPQHNQDYLQHQLQLEQVKQQQKLGPQQFYDKIAPDIHGRSFIQQKVVRETPRHQWQFMDDLTKLEAMKSKYQLLRKEQNFDSETTKRQEFVQYQLRLEIAKQQKKLGLQPFDEKMVPDFHARRIVTPQKQKQQPLNDLTQLNGIQNKNRVLSLEPNCTTKPPPCYTPNIKPRSKARKVSDAQKKKFGKTTPNRNDPQQNQMEASNPMPIQQNVTLQYPVQPRTKQQAERPKTSVNHNLATVNREQKQQNLNSLVKRILNDRQSISKVSKKRKRDTDVSSNTVVATNARVPPAYPGEYHCQPKNEVSKPFVNFDAVKKNNHGNDAFGSDSSDENDCISDIKIVSYCSLADLHAGQPETDIPCSSAACVQKNSKNNTGEIEKKDPHCQQKDAVKIVQCSEEGSLTVKENLNTTVAPASKSVPLPKSEESENQKVANSAKRNSVAKCSDRKNIFEQILYDLYADHVSPVTPNMDTTLSVSENHFFSCDVTKPSAAKNKVADDVIKANINDTTQSSEETSNCDDTERGKKNALDDVTIKHSNDVTTKHCDDISIKKSQNNAKAISSDNIPIPSGIESKPSVAEASTITKDSDQKSPLPAKRRVRARLTTRSKSRPPRFNAVIDYLKKKEKLKKPLSRHNMRNCYVILKRLPNSALIRG
uniref:uncharacterized protein LOC100179859 isoform X2 n=1 Tax=Ciona intestinalis TaxID=7719 RepID=UPI000EF4D626|nr:uncharacterized protein LOC100179859 isoform X2 [Ciona intestinalis]|eukprot:XP_026689419.1 uncharacterized protein LOC100179859 isoform X2 [Ciona intestinalis]